jgi:cellulose biosynthesis protein BcsQ
MGNGQNEMNAKVICMASAKGGSGKTTLTVTFATFLASLKKRVLVIDTDAATNGLTLMYLKEMVIKRDEIFSRDRTPTGVYDFSDERLTSSDIVTLDSGVEFIPATFSFINSEKVDIDRYRNRLSLIVGSKRSEYDFIFLDAQAGSDLFAYEAMSRKISDEVIIVSEYDPLSAAGIERLKSLFNKDLTYDRTWVLLNKMLPEFVQSFSSFLEVAKYLNPIPWDAEVVRAYARRKLALDLNRGNDFTLSIIQTLKSLVGDIVAGEIQEWLDQKATLIKEPVKSQLEFMHQKLEMMYLAKERSRRNILLFRAIAVTTVVGFILVFFYFIYMNQNNIFSSDGKVSIRNFLTIIPTIIVPLVFVIFALDESSIRIMTRVLLKKESSLDNLLVDDEIDYLKERIKKLKVLSDAAPEEIFRNRIENPKK